MTVSAAIWSAISLVFGFALGVIWHSIFGVSEEEAKRQTEKLRREMDEREVSR
jgi:muramidase (phage lysozyme)